MEWTSLTRPKLPAQMPSVANFLYGLGFTGSADRLTLPVGIVTTLIGVTCTLGDKS
jgi:hypothetical protein